MWPFLSSFSCIFKLAREHGDERGEKRLLSTSQARSKYFFLFTFVLKLVFSCSFLISYVAHFAQFKLLIVCVRALVVFFNPRARRWFCGCHSYRNLNHSFKKCFLREISQTVLKQSHGRALKSPSLSPSLPPTRKLNSHPNIRTEKDTLCAIKTSERIILKWNFLLRHGNFVWYSFAPKNLVSCAAKNTSILGSSWLRFTTWTVVDWSCLAQADLTKITLSVSYKTRLQFQVYLPPYSLPVHTHATSSPRVTPVKTVRPLNKWAERNIWRVLVTFS